MADTIIPIIPDPKIKPFVMADIETLDKVPSAVVLSIGAVSMNADGVFSETYHAHLNVQEQLDKGRTVSADTIGWWLSQSDEARADIKLSFLKEIPLEETLSAFRGFLERCTERGETAVYANGPEFDIVILESLFKTAGVIYPIDYYNVRSFREMKTRFPNQGPSFIGEKHNSLADAIHQANWLWNIEMYLAQHGV